MKNVWKKQTFMAKFHFQYPDSQYGSGLAILIRIHPDPCRRGGGGGKIYNSCQMGLWSNT